MGILMVGVGGQGVVLASDILAQVAVSLGYDAKKSEVHGMAQRGGVVSCHVRYGKEVLSAFIRRGGADIIVAFEEAEALRWLEYLKPQGVLIVNRDRIVPPIAFRRGYSYPKEAVEELKRRVKNLLLIEGHDMAVRLGNPKLVSSILLGALSNYLDLPQEEWERAITQRVPQATIDKNLEAFASGRNYKGENPAHLPSHL